MHVGCGGIALWRIEIQVNQLLAVSGEENSSTNENHIVLKGQLDTANTSFARIVAEKLFGLGKNSAPGGHGCQRGRPRRHCRWISGGDAAIRGRQPRSGVTVHFALTCDSSGCCGEFGVESAEAEVGH